MPRPISPEQLVYELTSVSAPTLSPDGSRVVFAQARVDRDSMENRSRLMSLNLSDSQASVFLEGAKDSGPAFSPDGNSIAFLRQDDKGKRHLWAVPASGGEPRQLTSLPGGVSEFAWSPDSRAIAFVSDVDPDLPPSDEGRKWPQVKVVRRIRYRADSIGWRGDAFRHVFAVDVDTGNIRQLTDGEGDDSTPAWSPDGSKIAFVSDVGEGRESTSDSFAFVVPSGGGEAKLASQGLVSVAALAWSPDGRRLAVVGSDDSEALAGWQGVIYILEPGQPPRQLTDDSVRPNGGYAPIIPPPEMRWTDDNRILFLGDARGQSFLCEASVEDGEVRRIAGGDAQYSAVTFDADATRAVVAAIPPDSAGDLRLIDLKGGGESQITEVNREYFAEHPAAELERFEFTRAGMKIEARVFLPPDFDPGQKHPLVLDIHGGPHGVFADAFNNVQQALATSGYIVLAVNPRGSSTYGIPFMKAVLRDWGGEDYLDIMAAVDEMCARPYVDAS
ncbi:MAG: prolyl oligopeptidase family serine peptidase, partial [Chloroflexi bacterium]|nr:prolyl oligopeptidase family serine peptidase [Chloroflexota bacterium]